MKEYDEEQIFTDKEIRDTNAHNSKTSFCERWARKTILVKNGLNQAVSIQTQGARDSNFTNVYPVGTALSVAAGANDYLTCADYFPYLRVAATCSTAPTTGNLNVWVEKLGV